MKRTQAVKNFVLSTITSNFPTDLTDTIVVTGSPRSGTTWLAELLREMPGYKQLNEPLHLDSAPRAREVQGLKWRTYVPENDDFPELEGLLHDAFTGREGSTWKWRLKDSNPLRQVYQHATRRKLIVKLIRAGRMLPWVTKRFPVRALVSTFRHPCAVVASQLNYGWSVSRYPEPTDLQETLGQFPNEIERMFGSVLANIDSPAGVLAAVWCIDTYMTLHQPVYRPWIVTTYEDLLERRTTEVHRILDALGEPVPQGLDAQLNEPSHSAADDLTVDDIERQLSKWQQRLDADQIDTVLSLVDTFGLTVYTEERRPNHQRLRQILTDGANTTTGTEPALPDYTL